jgi:hypothetical protein
MAIKIVEREVIKDDAITAAKVEDGTIVPADLTTNFITNAHVKSDAAIATSKITGLATSATTDTTNASNIASGTLPTARLDTGTTANKIVKLDGNAKLPAISGASLTGIESATVSTSDPVIATNPSGGVGTKWINKTSGEVYVCTDATAGANVWTNVGAGSGDVVPWNFPGETYGYCQGSGSPPAKQNVIDKWSFTSQANAADVGNLTVAGGGHAGSHTSSTHGYVAGGYDNSSNIDKYSFSTDGNAVDAGFDLSSQRATAAGSSSSTHAYTMAGGTTNENIAFHNVIDKYSFSASSNATDIGDVTLNRRRLAGCSSSTFGYAAGGCGGTGTAGPYVNNIDKVSFSTDGNATDVGDLTQGRSPDGSGVSSTTHGYVAGGYDDPAPQAGWNIIDKFSFASDGNSTDVGDLVVNRRHSAGSSAIDYGYIGGGHHLTGSPGGSGGSSNNEIQRWPFASDANSVDWADLTVIRIQCTGNQY